MNLIGLDLSYAPKDKEQKTTPEVAAPQSANDLSFVLMAVALILMSGAVIALSSALLVHAAKS
jgi:hypothetical protein